MIRVGKSFKENDCEISGKVELILYAEQKILRLPQSLNRCGNHGLCQSSPLSVCVCKTNNQIGSVIIHHESDNRPHRNIVYGGRPHSPVLTSPNYDLLFRAVSVFDAWHLTVLKRMHSQHSMPLIGSIWGYLRVEGRCGHFYLSNSGSVLELVLPLATTRWSGF